MLQQIEANACTNFFFLLILSEAVPVGEGVVAVVFGGGGGGAGAAGGGIVQ